MLKQPAYIPDMELVHQMHQFESEYSELVLDETRPFRFLASRPKDLKHSELAVKVLAYSPLLITCRQKLLSLTHHHYNQDLQRLKIGAK